MTVIGQLDVDLAKDKGSRTLKKPLQNDRGLTMARQRARHFDDKSLRRVTLSTWTSTWTGVDTFASLSR